MDAAQDADTWGFAITVGEGMGVAETLELSARTFNSIVHFLPPAEDHHRWRVAWQEVDSDDPDELEDLGEITTAQVIDVVPPLAEAVVLAATHEHIQWLEDEPTRRDAHLRLVAELDQATAHRARWRRRAERRYGDIVMYDFADDAELLYDLAEEAGRPALRISTSDDPAGSERVLIAPDPEHAWCYTATGKADSFGEWLDVHDALDRATAEHADWVRRETSLALGETLARIRTAWEAAGSSPRADQLAELARLARHAQELADGLATI